MHGVHTDASGLCCHILPWQTDKMFGQKWGETCSKALWPASKQALQAQELLIKCFGLHGDIPQASKAWCSTAHLAEICLLFPRQCRQCKKFLLGVLYKRILQTESCVLPWAVARALLPGLWQARNWKASWAESLPMGQSTCTSSGVPCLHSQISRSSSTELETTRYRQMNTEFIGSIGQSIFPSSTWFRSDWAPNSFTELHKSPVALFTHEYNI